MKNRSSKFSAEGIRASGAFTRAMNKASEVAGNASKLNDLLDDASKKLESVPGGTFTDLFDSLKTCLRLLKAVARGQYTNLPWQSLLLIVASVIYFVTPLDVVPDFLAAVGLADDAALFAWTLKTVKKDIDAFREWERTRWE